MTDLSILCVTRAEPHAYPFLRDMDELARDVNAELVIAIDGDHPSSALNLRALYTRVSSRGYIESVLDDALAACSGKWILRLDDDERVSPAMKRWLHFRMFTDSNHWKFPRVHLIDDRTYITQPPLWPDHQTRLSTRALSGGRHHIHAGSPHGGGALAPCAIEHHKFLVKSLAERDAIVRRYERLQPGAGHAFRVFSTPELLDGFDTASRAPYNEPAMFDLSSAMERARAIGMHQHDDEIVRFIEVVRARSPRHVVEIGTLHGGTMSLWHELSTGRVFSVDLPGGPFGGADHNYTRGRAIERNERLWRLYPRFHGVLGDSHDGDTYATVLSALDPLHTNEYVDLLFIDGDHSYESVRRDYALWSTLVGPGGIIAFHDIRDSKFHRNVGVQVPRFWRELPGNRHEIIGGDGNWGGIGYIEVPN